MINFEGESSVEEKRTRGQRTVRTSTSSTSIFGWQRKIRISKEKPNSIDSLMQFVKSFAGGNSQETISIVSKNVLKRATFCLEVNIFSNFCRTPVVVTP